jgi:uncharacterized protein
MANFNSNDTLKARLGSDLKYPISGSFEPQDGLAVLLQDMQILLLTIPGERVNRPDYGCGLRSYIWNNIDNLINDGPVIIRNCLTNYEPRIVVNSVTTTVNRNTDLVTFNIKFLVLATNTTANLVFPFRSSSQLSQA